MLNYKTTYKNENLYLPEIKTSSHKVTFSSNISNGKKPKGMYKS